MDYNKNFQTMKFILILCFSILLFSCSFNTNDFKKFKSSIPQLSFPISFNTMNYPDKKFQINIDSLLFEKYKSQYANEIFGKLYENEKSVGIIYTVYGDVLTPILMTYNNAGVKIDSLNLFDKASGYNPEQETYVTINFSQANKFKETDSTKTWNLDRHEERIDSSEQLHIDNAKYTITDNGKIIKQ